jgi:methionyl-tRNA formyltransferase
LKIVFFGTSAFAARILARLIQNKYQVMAIVTRPDRPRGRQLKHSPSPVKEIASDLCPAIPLFQPERASTSEFADQLKAFDADLFVVVAYGEILKQNLLDIPKRGCINIHASLLPKFRGAAPIQRSLMQGETETGITIIEMSLQMDAGDILAIKSLPVPIEMVFGELEVKLSDLAVELLFKTVRQFEEGSVVRTPQDHQLATFAPKLTAEEEKIDWTRSAEQIHNQIRALSPAPSAWCFIQIGSERKRLKIKKSVVVHAENAPAGTLLCFGHQGWVVACGRGALELLEVQLEGKKALPARECVRGISQPVSLVT